MQRIFIAIAIYLFSVLPTFAQNFSTLHGSPLCSAGYYAAFGVPGGSMTSGYLMYIDVVDWKRLTDISYRTQTLEAAGRQNIDFCKARGQRSTNAVVVAVHKGENILIAWTSADDRRWHITTDRVQAAIASEEAQANRYRAPPPPPQQTPSTAYQQPAVVRAPYDPNTWSPFNDPGLVMLMVFAGLGIGGFALVKISSANARSNELSELQRRENEVLQLRLEQIQALKEKLPKKLPTSMRATVQTNKHKDAKGDWAFTVDMIMELTEAERGIIKEYELDDIVLEDVPLYSKEDLDAQRANIQKHRDAFDGAFRKSTMLKSKLDENVGELVLEGMKKARLKTTIGQLIVVPFARGFDSPHEATEYSDKLKKELLPKMKALLKSHKIHQQTETLEFDE